MEGICELMKSGFFEKLIERLDRVDPKKVQEYLARLVQEKGVFERVFEALEEGVLVLDADGAVTFVNRSACRLLGVGRDGLEGTKLGDKIRGLDLKGLVADEGKGKAVSRDLEVTYPEHRYLNLYLAPLDGGEETEVAIGYVMIVRDITQSRKMTEEMIESERMNALTTLAAGVAHEIGNPLNSLTIHLQLMERKLRKASEEIHGEMAPMLEVAQGEIQRLDVIVKQFLAAIRPTTPQLELLDANRLIRESVRLLEPELRDREIVVEVDLSEAVPMILLDGGQMKQAFYNLIKNGYQAIGKGGRLVIESAFEDGGAILRFTDDGCGISAEEMGGIFEPYMTTKSSGTGLGLLIVRRIVREHGGEIGVQSEEGKGTSISIHLPVGDRGPRMLVSGEEQKEKEGVIDV